MYFFCHHFPPQESTPNTSIDQLQSVINTNNYLRSRPKCTYTCLSANAHKGACRTVKSILFFYSSVLSSSLEHELKLS